METDAEPLQPPGHAHEDQTTRPVEWLLALLPVEAALLVSLGAAALLLAASVFLVPLLLAAVRFRRLGSAPGRWVVAALLFVLALFTRLVVSEVFGGVGVL